MSDPVNHDELRSYVERIQRLTEERKTLARDIADVLSEAKANGFDKAAIKWVAAELSKDWSERQERDAIRDLYLQAIEGSHVHVPAYTRGAA